jgi:hypothetical protein
LLAHGKDKASAIFCECKWRNTKTPADVIDELIEKSHMFGFDKKYYYVFSKSGFTTEALKRAGDNINLIHFDDMF